LVFGFSERLWKKGCVCAIVVGPSIWGQIVLGDWLWLCEVLECGFWFLDVFFLLGDFLVEGFFEVVLYVLVFSLVGSMWQVCWN
jgi:hypothetical protein